MDDPLLEMNIRSLFAEMRKVRLPEGEKTVHEEDGHAVLCIDGRPFARMPSEDFEKLAARYEQLTVVEASDDGRAREPGRA